MTSHPPGSMYEEEEEEEHHEEEEKEKEAEEAETEVIYRPHIYHRHSDCVSVLSSD